MATSPLRLSYSAPISSLPTQQEMDAQELDRARNERATGWGPLNPIIQGYQGFAAGDRAGGLNQQALDAEVEFGKDSPAFSSLRRKADLEAQKSAIQRNRVGSIEDVHGVGDALNYLGGGLGQVAGSMAPTIAGAAAGALVGGPGGALVGGLRGALIRGAAPLIGGTIAGYDMNRGETVSGQYADPQAMERSAQERSDTASMTALGKSALDAIPAAYGLRALSGAGKVARAERLMSRPMQTLTGAAGESGTEMLQTEADYQGLQALGSTKERNLAEYADAGILGAVGGGVFSGATNLVGAGMDKGADATQAVKDNKYVQEGTELATKGAKAAYEVGKTALGLTFDATTGAVKGIDRAAQHLGVKDWTAKGIKDSTTKLVEQLKNSPLVEPVIDAANKAVDATQGILGPEHFDTAATSLGAAMQAKTWSELVRNSFGNPFSEFLARAGLTDVQDPAVLDGSKTPEAAAAERDGILESGRRQAAHTILNSPAFSPSDKQKVLSMGVNGDYSKLDAEQTVWLANRVASRYFAPKLDEIYNGGRDLLQQLADHVFGALNKTDAAADPTKRNSQVGTRSDFSELITAARVRPLTAALASLSTDRAGNAPAHARQLLQINDALQQVGYLTLEQRSFVTNLSTRLMEYDKKDAVVKALQEAGANDLLNALTQEREAPGALADLRSETSWLRSLTPEVAALPRSTLESIAGFVDEYAIKYISPGLNEHQRDAILAMAIRAFGSEEVAHNALTEFGQQRMEGLEAAWQEQAAQADAAAEQEAADYRAANPAQVAEAERVLAMNGYEGARLQEAIDRHLKKKFGKKLDEVTADDIADAMVAVAADVEAEYEGATGEFDASSTYGAEYGALTEQGPSGLEASFKLRNPNRPFRNDDRALSNEAMAKRTAADPSARVMPLLDYLEGAGIDPALYVRKMAKDFQSLLRNGEGHRAAYEQFKKETGYAEEADDQKEALSVDVGTPIPEEEGGGTRVTSPFRQKLEALQLAVKRAGLNLIRPEILGGLSAEWATIARKDKATPASKPHTGPEFPHILRDLADFDVSANTGQRILRGNYDVDRAALLKDFIARFAPGGDLEARIKRNEARIEAGKARLTTVADAMIAALSEAKIEKTDPKMEYAFGIRDLGRALDALEEHMDSEPNPYRGLKNYSVIASERNDTIASDALLEKFKNTIANKTRATDEEIQAVKINFRVVGGMTKMTLAADSMMAASPEKGGSMLTRFLGALGAVLNRPDVVGLDMTDKQLNDMVVSRKLGITFGELVKREQKRFSKAGDVKKLREQLAKRAKATEEQKAAHKAKYAAGVSTAEAEWRKSRGDVESVARQARTIWQRFVNSSLEKLGPVARARRGADGLLRNPAYYTYRADQPLNERESADRQIVDPIQLLRDSIASREEGPLTSALRDILAGMEAIRLKGTPTEEFLDSMQRIKDGLASLDGSEAITKLREEIAGAAKDSKKLVRLNAQLKTLTENNGELAKLSTLASRIRSLKSKAKKKGEPVEDFNTDLALIDNRVRNIVNAAYPTKKRDTSTDLDEDNEVRGLQATEQTNAIVNAYLNSAVLEERADIYDALRMFTDADRARAAAAAFESDVAKFEDEERRFVDETTGEYLDARITNAGKDVEPAGALTDNVYDKEGKYVRGGEFVKGTPTSVTQDRPSRRVLARMALNAAQATVAKLTKLKTIEPAQITQLRIAKADVAGLTDFLNREEAWEKRKPETIEGGESPQFGDLNARLDAAQGAWAQLNNEIKLMEQFDQVKAERKTALDAYKAVYNDKTASQEALDEAKEAFEALDAEFKTLKEPDAQELEALKAQRKSAASEWRTLDRVVFNDPVKKAKKTPSDKTEAEEVADAIKRLQNRIDTGRAGTPYVYKPRMDELLTRAEQLATPVVEGEAAPKKEAAPTVPTAIAETILRAPVFAHKKETAKALGAKQIMAPQGVRDAWSSALAATAKRLGILLNKGKNAASGAIIYASVPGNGRDWSKAARDAFIEELKDAMDAGAYIRLDTAKMAFSKHNIEGEGVVHKALHDAGYTFKEVKGLYGVWSYPDTQQETQTEASGNSFEIVKQDFGKKIDGVIDGHRAGSINVTNARPGGPGALGNPFVAVDAGGKLSRKDAVAKFKEAFLKRVNSDPAYKAWALSLRGKKIGYYKPDEQDIHLHEVQKWLAKQPVDPGDNNDPTQRSSYVGKKGDAAGAYKAARKITAKDGFDPKELFEKTGWFLGPDGKLRKELDPTPIVDHIKTLFAAGKTATTVRDVLKATYPKLLEAYDRAAKKDKAARSFGDITIDLNAPPTKGRPLHAGAFNAKDWRIKVIPHAAYAQFTLGPTAASRTDDQRAKMTVELMQQSGAIDLTSAVSIVATATPEQLHAGVSAAYPEVAALTLEDMTQQAVAYVFIHELQHAIQEVEGFSRGGNRESGLISKYGDPALIKEAQAEYQRNEYDGPAYKAALKQATEAAAKSGDVAAAANAAYGSITGEQEANDVQNRLNLTPAQRGEALPVLMSPKNEFLMSVFRETPVPDITPDQTQKKTTPAERRAAKAEAAAKKAAEDMLGGPAPATAAPTPAPAAPTPAPAPAPAAKAAPAAPQAAPAAPQAPAPKARKRPKRVNPTAVHPVAAEIQKIVYTSLGKGPRLKLDQTVAQMGRQGYFSGQAGELIAIAIDTADPLGNTHHEVMHAFFARLGFDRKSRELKNTLTSAVSQPHVLAKLEDFVKGMPDALAAIKQGAPHYLEERLALAYQIYTTGGPAALGLTPAVRNIFGKIAAYFRSVLNLLNEAEVTEKVMLMLHSGELASPNTIHEKLATLRIETSQQTFDRYVPYVGDAVRSVFKAGSDVLRDSGVQVLVDVADKFEGINGELGFIDRRARVENIFTSRLAKLLDKHTEEEIREATESAQAMRQLKPGLETEVAKLLNDVFAYMDKKGVKTSRWVEGTGNDPGYVEWIPIQKINKGRYFPRQWDGEYITTHEKEWNELLTKNGVSPSDAAKLTEAIIKGDGRLELKEGEHHLGFTPYVKALQHRGLQFINEKNAAAFAEFQSKDTVDILTTYIRQAAHRGEYAELFGNNGEVIESAIADSKLSVDEKVKMRRTISGLEGTLGWDMPQSTKELFSAGLTIQNVLLLPLAIYSQMIDPLMIAARSGDVMDAGRAYLEALKQLKNKITGERTEAQDLADMMGMLSEESVIAAMGNTHGSMYMSGGFRKFNEMFFRYNGLQGWNQSMRSAATLAGVRYLVKHKDNATELAEIGLKPSDVVVGPNNSLVVKGNKKVQEALFRFVDESVVRPNATHRPTWMSDPRFMLIAHLKQFTFSQHKVILGRVVDQAEKGNYQPAAMLALAAPVMLAADMAKWMMTGTVPDSWTWGDYASHAVQRAGILGKGQFAADALNDAARGGTPGTSFLGPTFEHLATLFQGLTGSASGTEVLERSIPAGRYIL